MAHLAISYISHYMWNTHYISEGLFSCPCYPVGSSSLGTWQVRSDSHWNETQNDPTKAQPTDNESTLCWQPLLPREMSMGLLPPAISLSWWQPWPLLCLQAICFPGCWKAGKYEETLQNWCMLWPCLIIICYEVALSWRLRLPAALAQLPLAPYGGSRVAFGEHCFSWAGSWLSKELGDCRQQSSHISAVPCCSANSTVLQTLGIFAVTNSETSLPNSNLEILAVEVIAIGKKLQFPRETSSTSSWIPIQFTYTQDIHVNSFADDRVQRGQDPVECTVQNTVSGALLLWLLKS